MSGISVHSLGCKVNFADTEAVAAALTIEPDAPVEIIGTCCVTGEGEKQSRKEVRRALKRVGPDGTVFVTGCAARLTPAVFEAMGENVVTLAGEPEAAAARIAGSFPAAGITASVWEDRPAPAGRTRFFLKVQDGCANMCSYCVVPLVRGRPRSLPLEEILEAAERRLADGYPELVVCGIDVGAWRDGGKELPDLLERLAGAPGLVRLRLSSIEAAHITTELVNVIAGNDIIGRHLHIPLQSGDDCVLKSMGRRYDREFFSSRIAAVRELLPEVNLTTDAIVGYPTEDEHAFDSTMDYVAAAGFSKVHVFSYSPRPGTKAAGLGDPVPAPEKKRRSRLLRELSDTLGERHRQRKVGRVSEILLESRVSAGMVGGYSSDYTRFVVAAGHEAVVARVRAEVVTGDAIMGKIVEVKEGRPQGESR